MPGLHRDKLIAMCIADRASLAATYLPPLITELTADLSAGHDAGLANTLQSAHSVCERLGVRPG